MINPYSLILSLYNFKQINIKHVDWIPSFTIKNKFIKVSYKSRFFHISCITAPLFCLCALIIKQLFIMRNKCACTIRGVYEPK